MSVPAGTAVVWPARYELLDGLRGLAALAVVLHHLQVIDVGHFAVMVFFVISGYCITASAESCRRNGIGFKSFMARRLRRIFPPYLLAVGFFALTRAVKLSTRAHNDLQRPLLDWVQNLTLTQWLSDLAHPIAWPGDNPKLFVTAFWSLNYEEQFYLVMAVGLLLALRKRIPLMVPVLLLAVIGLAWNWSVPGNWICGLFIEYWAHFALGSCLYFVLCRFTGLRARRAFTALALLLAAAAACRLYPWNPDTLGDMRAMVELSYLCAVTLGLLFLRPWSAAISRSALWRPIAALGTISYSLYLVHQFNLTLVASAARHMLPAGSPRIVLLVTMVMLHLVLATLFWYFCERPFLRKSTALQPAIPPAVEAARIA